MRCRVWPKRWWRSVRFFSSRRRHTRSTRDWSSDVCSSDLAHDEVGRYLQGHIYAGAVGVFDEVVQDCKGPGPSISTTDFRHHNERLLGGGILVNEFVPIPLEAWSRLTAAGLVPAWGEDGVRGMRDAYPRAVFVVGPVHEVPQRGSRVTIEPGLTDRQEMPVVRLLGDGAHDEDLRTARFLGARATEWLGLRGA